MTSKTGILERPELERRLQDLGQEDEERLGIGEAALLLGAWDRPRVPLARYQEHLDQLGQAAEAALTPLASDATAHSRLMALTRVICEDFGYQGDERTYDDLQNANLLRVIDRRKGLPVALGILYLHISQQVGPRQGWRIVGLNFPGHFVLRLETAGARLVFDPFRAGTTYDASGLRQLLKAFAGPEAELHGHYTEPVTSRDTLIRLQNNIKTRRIQHNDIPGALDSLHTMRLLAPERAGFIYETAILEAQQGNIMAAIQALEAFLRQNDNQQAQHQAARLLQELKSQLN